jgi:metal-sulfur cluster biosynthetic enzyme
LLAAVSVNVIILMILLGETVAIPRYRQIAVGCRFEPPTSEDTVKLRMSLNTTTGPTTPVPTRDDILEMLRAVIDPELGSDVVSLGMIPEVVVSPPDSAGGVDVTVWVKLTIGGCPLRDQIKKDVESRIALHPAVRNVSIEWGEMTSDERTDVMLKARWAARENAPDTEVPQSCRILAIASGKGGVGKSSAPTSGASRFLACSGSPTGWRPSPSSAPTSRRSSPTR